MYFAVGCLRLTRVVRLYMVFLLAKWAQPLYCLAKFLEMEGD